MNRTRLILNEAIIGKKDGYALYVSKTQKIPYNEVTPDQRREAKKEVFKELETEKNCNVSYLGSKHICISFDETEDEVTHFIKSGHKEYRDIIWYAFKEDAYDTEPKVSGISPVLESRLISWFGMDLTKLSK